jgi:ABC-type Fe3+/spermidine/putrescine transport system ATPase subunit
MTATATHAARLELSDLKKLYGDIAAVEQIDLTVEPGEFVTLLGPSGSGKSTTLGMVAGFETPTSGTIRLGERDITRLVTHKRNLGKVFQGYALFPHMTVFENVAFPMKLRKASKHQTRTAVGEALEAVSLGHLADRKPSQLSGGQQQRVALARAFVHRPPILLMDEPLSALDKALRTQMRDEIRRLHRELGTTVLFVTHDQEEALSLSDRIVVMCDGRISQVGTPTEMYESPQNEFVSGFLGAANFLSGTPEHVAAGTVGGVRLGNGQRVCGRATVDVPSGCTARIVLRPEDGQLGGAPSPDWNEFRVTLTELVYLGERIKATGKLESGEELSFWVSHHQAGQVAIGRQLVLSWPHRRTVLIESPA